MNIPKISIITPSFNQADFLERTICSVLDQKYPNLEYILIDGGSNDGSVEIIKKYSNYFNYWVTQKDNGQAHAINKGLKLATGDWIAWQNSDDIFYPYAFEQLIKASEKYPNAELIIGNINTIDSNDLIINKIKYVKPSYGALLAEGMVLTNQAAFWKKSLHDEIGFLNEKFDCGFDYDWFLRILKNKKKAAHVNSTWGALRIHDKTKGFLKSNQFLTEYKIILKGRKIKKIAKLYYIVRRGLYYLVQGEFNYFIHGLLNKTKKLMP